MAFPNTRIYNGVWNSGVAQVGNSTPQVAVNASEVFRNNRNLTEYIYVSTVQGQRPGYIYQFKSQTERIQALQGRMNTPQAQALRNNGGQCANVPNIQPQNGY
jgi:hypothetical protein